MARPHCPVCGAEGTVAYQDLSDRIGRTPGRWTLVRCGNDRCRSLWLDPAPTARDIGRAYDDYYTHRDQPSDRDSLLRRVVGRIQPAYLAARWGYSPPATPLGLWRLLALLPRLHPGLRAYLDFSVMYLPASSTGRLLDVGCGNGDTLSRLAALGWQVEGVEPDARAVAVARARGLRVHHGDVSKVARAAEPYDVITLSHVIEHVHDPIGTLRACRELLTPRGRVIVATPNVGALMHRRFGRHWLSLDPPRHLCLFSTDSLRMAAERAGFGHVEVRTTVREVDAQYVAGRSIQRTGRYRWGDRGPWLTRGLAQAWQYREAIEVAAGLAEGEELLMIARP